MNWQTTLKREYSREELENVTFEVQKNDKETDIVMRVNGMRSGYLNTAHTPKLVEEFKSAKIVDMYINEGLRGKGFGKEMYNKLLVNLPPGVEKLYGQWENENAKSFWKYMGFTIDGKRIIKKIK